MSGHSFEAKVFNVVVSFVHDTTTRGGLASLDSEALGVLDQTAPGVSLVIDPFAEVISETMQEDEGLLVQEIDLDACIEPQQFHDVSGYYNRFDIFDLRVDRRRVRPITLTDPVDGEDIFADKPPAHRHPSDF